MAPNRQQRHHNRFLKTFNWNKREAARGKSDKDFIRAEFQRVEQLARTLKANADQRWRRELQRRMEEENEEKRIQEAEIQVWVLQLAQLC